MNNAAPSTVAPFLDTNSLRLLLRSRRRVPVATYRLQLHAGFTFQDARAIVPYLSRLGVTDCYLSPFFIARPGSIHGYDICEFGKLNPELGAETDYQALCDELRAHDMGQIIDFVPNHMAVEPGQNRWWRELLEDGPSSPLARFFDIDWDPLKPELKGKVLLPFLGDHYGLVLERGEMQLGVETGALVLRYGEVSRPIDPKQYPFVLRRGIELLQAELRDDEQRFFQEFLSILTELENLPDSTETAPDRVAERQREKSVARERLLRIIGECPRIARHIDECVREINGQVGKPESFDRLHELLERQRYRLAYWKTAVHEINYRRFSDINELAGLRMEDPAVFSATHELVLRLVAEGKISGVRLDHIDGLFAPAAYLQRLQEAIVQSLAVAILPAATDATDDWRAQVASWRNVERESEPNGLAARPFFMVVEKILSATESLPESWPVEGTTGYDFLNDLNRLFVDSQNARAMRSVYKRFTGQEASLVDVIYDSKKLITETALASELSVLAHALNRISEGDRRARDYTLESLREALAEIVACFPVYRTYVNAAGAAETDRRAIDLALARARWRNPAMEVSVFDFVREALLPEPGARPDAAEYQARLQFAMKFQQYTAPVHVKGLEDTAFYRYNLLASLNEVGGDPQRFGASPSQFHDANLRRHADRPRALLATATHDTKRGEDARARLNVLSEIPGQWRTAISRWARLNARHRTTLEGSWAPDRNDEYLIYQALLSAWPAEGLAGPNNGTSPEFVERVRRYVLKAIKEAKVHTSWINPNEIYDQATERFVEQCLKGPRAQRFLDEFIPLATRVARLGMINSLAQVALKLVSPGVPDFYQGSELWDLSFVDPDNRRGVDFALRERLLAEMETWIELEPRDIMAQGPSVGEMLEHWHDGRIKLFITAMGLRLRRQLPRLFLEGDYVPLDVEGEHADRVVAAARCREESCVLVVTPRLVERLMNETRPWPLGAATWGSTRLKLPPRLAAGGFRNLLTRELVHPRAEGDQPALDVAECLATCPVGIFVRDAASTD